MIKVGVTGQNGFIGYHLCQMLDLNSTVFSRIEFERSFFEDPKKLDSFLLKCDVLVHLSAINRMDDEELLYKTNLNLVNQIILSLERINHFPHLIISSSTQEELNNMYGLSKKESRELLGAWAEKSKAIFSGLIIPNVFGPFALPFYNSVVSTFCYQITRNIEPKIIEDKVVKFIYVQDLINEILKIIRNKINSPKLIINHSIEIKVSDLLDILLNFKNQYQNKGIIPNLEKEFYLQLFNTYRSYIDYSTFFPKRYKVNEDDRGSFVEIVKLNSGGQISYSTTLPGITRGNHFHTRKVERFSVIKGKAKIQMRKVGTPQILEFFLDGESPSFVDIPIWYTHNIMNIGKTELIAIFWINEHFDNLSPDTFFQKV